MVDDSQQPREESTETEIENPAWWSRAQYAFTLLPTILLIWALHNYRDDMAAWMITLFLYPAMILWPPVMSVLFVINERRILGCGNFIGFTLLVLIVNVACSRIAIEIWPVWRD